MKFLIATALPPKNAEFTIYIILWIAPLALTLPLIIFFITRVPEDVGQTPYGYDKQKSYKSLNKIKHQVTKNKIFTKIV